MNKEIKEILDRLERIDHKKYKTAFEFADSAEFDEMARCFKERMIMADYITNLQDIEQEHQKLNGSLREELKATQELVVNYKSRCEKAIAHINDRILKGFEKFGYDPDIVAPIIVNDLLNILNGEDNDLNKKELIDILKG